MRKREIAGGLQKFDEGDVALVQDWCRMVFPTKRIMAEQEMLIRFMVILAVLAGCTQSSVRKADNNLPTYQSNEEYFED